MSSKIRYNQIVGSENAPNLESIFLMLLDMVWELEQALVDQYKLCVTNPKKFISLNR